MTTFDPRGFAEAVAYAGEVHGGQSRKRAADDDRHRIPYVSHLLAVAALVVEDGGGTDDAIAGLLHDVLEDQDSDGTRRTEIAERFGRHVLGIVEACPGPKKEEPGMAEFRVRKAVYLDRLRAEEDPSAVRVSLADKVHNARSTVNDLEADGVDVWRRFNAGPDDQLWWYGELATAYTAHANAGRADPARAAESCRLVARMGALTPPG